MDEQRKQTKPRDAGPSVAAPPLPADEFGGDLEVDKADTRQRDRWRSIPTVGTERTGRTLWNVCVRHSPFLFKQANVWASDKKEAHQAFLEAAKQHHEAVANRERGPAQRPAARAVHEAYERGLEMTRAGKLKWSVRPWEDVKRERSDYRELIFNLMSRERQLAEMMAGKPPTPALTPG